MIGPWSETKGAIEPIELERHREPQGSAEGFEETKDAYLDIAKGSEETKDAYTKGSEENKGK